MTSVSDLNDINHQVHPVKAGARVATLNAGDTAAEIARNGSQIDLRGLPRTFRSVQIVQPFRITQDTAKSITVKIKAQHRSSTTGAGSTWADVTAAAHRGSTGTKTVQNTTTSTDQVTDAVAQAGIPLEGLKRFFRTVTTPDFNATATGPTLDLDAPLAIFGGPDRTPAQG